MYVCKGRLEIVHVLELVCWKLQVRLIDHLDQEEMQLGIVCFADELKIAFMHRLFTDKISQHTLFFRNNEKVVMTYL